MDDLNKSALYFPSDRVSGAEKRFINMAFMFNKLDMLDIKLFIHESALNHAKSDEKIRSKISFLESKKSIVILKNATTKNVFFRFIHLIFHLLRAIRLNNIRLLHTGSGLLYIIPFLKLFKVKIVYEVTSPDNVDLLVKTNKFFLKSIDYFSCVSLSVFKRLVDKKFEFNNLRFSKYPFYISQYAVDNVFNKERVIMYCSRFIPRKNPILFLKVGIRILKLYPDYRLVMLGDGPLEDDLKCIMSVSEVKDRVSIYRSNNPFEEFEKSQIFVSLIEPDNVPSQSVLEACDTGNIIIVSDTGNSKLYISKNNGYLCSLDEEAVFSAIEEAINSSEESKEMMAKNSKQLIIDKFPVSDYLNELIALYRVLL